MQVFLARKHLNDNFHIRYSEHLGKFCNPEGYVATVSTVGTVKGDAGVALQKFPESKIIMIKIIIKTNFSTVKGVALKNSSKYRHF